MQNKLLSTHDLMGSANGLDFSKGKADNGQIYSPMIPSQNTFRMQTPRSSIHVEFSDKSSIAHLYIRGVIEPSFYYTDVFMDLNSAHEKCDTLIVHLSSPGGSADTMSEIIALMGMFDCSVTINRGQIASAATNIWFCGDVRVAQRHSLTMIHRESYGNVGKTAEHNHLASVTEEVFGGFYDEIYREILTPEEFERARLTEVFLSDKELIKRGVCISWEDFLDNASETIQQKMILNIHGVDYMQVSDTEVARGGKTFNINYLRFMAPADKVEPNKSEAAEAPQPVKTPPVRKNSNSSTASKKTTSRPAKKKSTVSVGKE